MCRACQGRYHSKTSSLSGVGAAQLFNCQIDKYIDSVGLPIYCTVWHRLHHLYSTLRRLFSLHKTTVIVRRSSIVMSYLLVFRTIQFKYMLLTTGESNKKIPLESCTVCTFNLALN